MGLSSGSTSGLGQVTLSLCGFLICNMGEITADPIPLRDDLRIERAHTWKVTEEVLTECCFIVSIIFAPSAVGGCQ